MNYRKYTVIFYILFITVSIFFSASTLFSQPEKIILDHTGQCKKKERSNVIFPHETHMESMDCIDCHHKYKNNSNVLDENELEEGNPDIACSACHKMNTQCQLMNVYHGQCLACHNKNKKNCGLNCPRLCNDCHPKKKR